MEAINDIDGDLISLFRRIQRHAEEVKRALARYCHSREEFEHLRGLPTAGLTNIECMPWQKCLKRYDNPDTLFYQDPPYLGHEADYGEGVFSCDDYPRLAAMLRQIQGRFLLSMNDAPQVREHFEEFSVRELRTVRGHGAKDLQKVVELLFSNVKQAEPGGRWLRGLRYPRLNEPKPHGTLSRVARSGALGQASALGNAHLNRSLCH